MSGCSDSSPNTASKSAARSCSGRSTMNGDSRLARKVGRSGSFERGLTPAPVSAELGLGTGGSMPGEGGQVTPGVWMSLSRDIRLKRASRAVELRTAGCLGSDEAIDMHLIRARIRWRMALFCDGGIGTITAVFSRNTPAWLKKRKNRRGRHAKA